MRRTLLLSLILLALPASAAQWVTVSRDKGRTIEIDRASVLASDAGTKVAWGRIVMSEKESESAGYHTVKALNRYDCRSQTFITIRRVYQDAAGLELKEEKIAEGAPIAIRPGSVDDRIFKEVCQPASFNQLRALAGIAADKAESSVQTASRQSERLKRADLKLAKNEEAPAEAPAAGKISPRPQMIDLPPRPPHAPEAAASTPTRAYTPPPPAARIYPAPTRMRKPMAPKPAMQAAAPHAGEPPHLAGHWSYEGEAGPQNWARLSPEYATCAAGTRQSPIDIRSGIKVELDPIKFDYRPSYFRIVDNGHTIQVNVGSGLMMSVMGRSYELQQFHFHRPAEERIDGKPFDMVVHLVHKDMDGRLAVVALLLERGSAHPLIQTLWNNLPLEKNESYAPPVAINPMDLLPAERGYYTYMGSLTTPPCSEGVLWMVMKQPAAISDEQIGIFSRFYRNNARPIQGSSERIIKESR